MGSSSTTSASFSVQRATNPYDLLPPAPQFQVVSRELGEWVPDLRSEVPPQQRSKIFGVEGGEDISPSLSWSGYPEETKSFVVSMYDPDAPTVSGFWHWFVYDIPADVGALTTGAGNATDNNFALPEGAKMLKNDAGFAGYVGAAPPACDGTHRYLITVSALPVESLPIDPSTSPAVANFNMYGAGVIARGFLNASLALGGAGSGGCDITRLSTDEAIWDLVDSATTLIPDQNNRDGRAEDLNDSGSDDCSLSAGAIAGIAIACGFVALVTVFLLVAIGMRRKTDSADIKSDTTAKKDLGGEPEHAPGLGCAAGEHNNLQARRGGFYGDEEMAAVSE